MLASNGLLAAAKKLISGVSKEMGYNIYLTVIAWFLVTCHLQDGGWHWARAEILPNYVGTIHNIQGPGVNNLKNIRKHNFKY